MNRGAARAPIFLDPTIDRRIFLAVLAETAYRFGFRIVAYALMPNHYHLLVQLTAANLSAGLQRLDGRFTQKLNQRHRRDGPLFRGRFKSIFVDNDAYLLHLIRYIHMNGVRGGLAAFPAEDPWCSHAAYMGTAPAPAWLARNDILSRFPTTDEFDAFVRERIPEEWIHRLEASEAPKRGRPEQKGSDPMLRV
jgi:REP element-mobilizing transposase RayT